MILILLSLNDITDQERSSQCLFDELQERVDGADIESINEYK
jgi:hypothetical protein